MIIERVYETTSILQPKRWILIYGRRKTGKTFLVENFIKYDEYFFVKRDRTLISKKGDEVVSYEAFIQILRRALDDNKVVVVDEFHRLGEDFFDYLHYTKKTGKLILVSSTLFLSKRLFSGRSALLGFFSEVPIGLIRLADCVSTIRKLKTDKKSIFELAILLREPIAVTYVDEKADPRKTFSKVLLESIRAVPALVGEIFIEEERHISAIYEGILRAIAAGKVVSSEISSYLFSRKLIQKDDPSIIQQHLSNLAEVGVIKKIAVYGKKRFIYKHMSPLARIFYYADEKYNISERVPSEKEVRGIIDDLMPKIVEDSVRECLAEKYGLKEAISEAKDYDVDACLLKFNKPAIVLEVKWKAWIGKDDVLKAEKNTSSIRAERRLFFVPDKRSVGFKSDIVEFIDASDL